MSPLNCASFSANLATSNRIPDCLAEVICSEDTHDRLMSKKEDVILESVTGYAKNPDTYDNNIEILKSQPDVSFQNSEACANFVRC
jgi:hypothetical protein